MPTWNQIQSQLRNPQNPVVFFDISVGRTVCLEFIKFYCTLKKFKKDLRCKVTVRHMH